MSQPATPPIIHQVRQEVEKRNYRLNAKQVRQFTLLCENAAQHGATYPPAGSPIALLDGTPLLSSYNRLVIGAHGPYLEFEEKDLLLPLVMPDDQRWRLDPKYHVKYLHVTPQGRAEKIYKQLGPVSYADYLPGKLYIDLYLVRPAAIKE